MNLSPRIKLPLPFNMCMCVFMFMGESTCVYVCACSWWCLHVCTYAGKYVTRAQKSVLVLSLRCCPSFLHGNVDTGSQLIGFPTWHLRWFLSLYYFSWTRNTFLKSSIYAMKCKCNLFCSFLGKKEILQGVITSVLALRTWDISDWKRGWGFQYYLSIVWL